MDFGNEIDIAVQQWATDARIDEAIKDARKLVARRSALASLLSFESIFTQIEESQATCKIISNSGRHYIGEITRVLSDSVLLKLQDESKFILILNSAIRSLDTALKYDTSYSQDVHERPAKARTTALAMLSLDTVRESYVQVDWNDGSNSRDCEIVDFGSDFFTVDHRDNKFGLLVVRLSAVEAVHLRI